VHEAARAPRRNREGTEESQENCFEAFSKTEAGNATAALDALSDAATLWIREIPLSEPGNKAQLLELLGSGRY